MALLTQIVYLCAPKYLCRLYLHLQSSLFSSILKARVDDKIPNKLRGSGHMSRGIDSTELRQREGWKLWGMKQEPRVAVSVGEYRKKSWTWNTLEKEKPRVSGTSRMPPVNSREAFGILFSLKFVGGTDIESYDCVVPLLGIKSWGKLEMIHQKLKHNFKCKN